MLKKKLTFSALALSAALLLADLPVMAAGQMAPSGSGHAAIDTALLGITGVTGTKKVSTTSNSKAEQESAAKEEESKKEEKEEIKTEETAQSQTEDSGEDEASDADKDDEFGHLVIARVDSYVNVRLGPTTDAEKLGKLYNNSVGELIRRDGDWLLISSGTITGFVKAEYVVYGEEAEAMIDEVMVKKATVKANSLNFRSEPNTDASVYQHLPKGAVYNVLEVTDDNWVKIKVGSKEGYVSGEYVNVEISFVCAESKEEEKARLEAEAAARAEQERREREAEAAAQAAAQQSSQSSTTTTTAPAQTEAEIIPADTSSEGAALGQAVVDFAVQFVGNPYVYGGTSLTKGADCSGFVLSVYKEFGVSLPHSATADQKMGTAVASLDQARPGDLLCYSGHVGIYIGNGKFVHASNPKGGIKIGDANYRKILAIRRIFN